MATLAPDLLDEESNSFVQDTLITIFGN